LNEATDLGLNANLSFRNKRFKVLTETVHKIYLSETELIEIYNLNLSGDKRLERVRDLFLVGCWTGLRFGDLVNIAPENVVGNKISIKTQKTGEVVVIPLHWMVKSIMKRYADYPNSLPPAISNTKMNKYLKEIASQVPCLQEKVRVSITKGGRLITETKSKWEMVSTHTCRRSFATILYLEGISSLTIMKLTSHKSEKVFLSYLKASAEDNANLLQKHWLEKERAGGISEHQNLSPHQPQLAGSK
jgi:integrase